VLTTHVDDVVLSQGGFIMKMSTSSVDTPVRRDVSYYTIKPGDTVQNVAGRFGLTVDTLRWANNIADVTSVVQGQRLVVPPVNGILVKVQPSTQLSGLAVQYHVNVQDIIDFNLIRDPSHLRAGNMLMLPDGVGPALDTGGVGKKTVKSVTWSRFGRQVTNYTISYSASPLYGSGGKFPYGYCTWWVAHKRSIPWSAMPGSGGMPRSSSDMPRARCLWSAPSWCRASAGLRRWGMSATSSRSTATGHSPCRK
jgi:LysM repeat protein